MPATAARIPCSSTGTASRLGADPTASAARSASPTSAPPCTRSVPSDPWMVWCLNCPSLAGEPMLMTCSSARLPVKTLAGANAVVAKRSSPTRPVTPDQTWRKKMLICADDQCSDAQSFFGGDPGGPRYCFKGLRAGVHPGSATSLKSVGPRRGLPQGVGRRDLRSSRSTSRARTRSRRSELRNASRELERHAAATAIRASRRSSCRS